MWVRCEDGTLKDLPPVEEPVLEAIADTNFNPPVTMADVKWDGINGCYYFHRAGMFIGVETDGYMHS